MTARGATTHGKAPASARTATGRGKVRAAHTAHERQAESAGAAFSRGETGLGARLTPAPAARFHLPGSVPRALPTPLRGQLEQAYAADLSGLRVFDDAASHAAARAFGAHAFAAGADLYFGANAWRPDRADGRARIAHEVAHALQQSGRAASAGRVRVEPRVEGDDGVQRDTVKASSIEDTITRQHLLTPTSRTERQAVVERHVDSPAERIPAAVADQLRTAVGGSDLAAATSSVDKLLASLSQAQWTPGVSALFFDVYKSLGQDAKATTVAAGKPPERTAFGSWTFYLSQRRQDASWVVPLLQKAEVAGRYFPDALVRAVQIDFLSALDKPTPVTVDGSFERSLSDAIDLAHDYRPRMPEEGTLVALIALRRFDAIRRAAYADLTSQAGSETTMEKRFAMRLAIARHYTDPAALADEARKRGAEPEVVKIADEVGRLAAPLAKHACAYWSGVEKLVGDILPGHRKSKAEFLRREKMTAALHDRLPKIAALGDLDTSLVAILNRALQLKGGDVPDDAALTSNRAAARDLTEDLATKLQKKVSDANAAQSRTASASASASTALGTDAPPSDALIAGAVLLIVDILYDVLDMAINADATPDDDQMSPAMDEAVKDFIQVAVSFGLFARVLGLTGFAAAAAASRDATRSDLTHSHVALLKPFVSQPSPLSEFARDFPRGKAKDGAFYGSAPVEWAYLMFDEDMMVELEKALEQVTPSGLKREFDASTDAEPIVNTAMKAVWSHDHLPRRHRVPKASTILYVRAADEHDVSSLVDEHHPKLQAMRKRLHGDTIVITPRERSQHEDGFVVWELPDMTPLADAFAKVPGVVDLKLPNGERLGMPSQQESGAAWLIRLNTITTIDPTIHAAMEESIHARRLRAEQALEPLYRRATNNERKKVAALITEQWKQLPVHSWEPTYDSVPRKVFALMRLFAMGVRPDTLDERRLQMTALMLELAPVMKDELRRTDRLDIVLQLHGDLVGAATFVADPKYGKAAPLLLTGLDAEATSDRVKQLISLADGFRQTAQDRQATRMLDADATANTLSAPGFRFTVDGGPGGDAAQAPESASFMADGIVYTLVKVHKSFRYQPELLVKQSAIDWGKTVPLGSARLWFDGREHVPGEPPVKLLTMTTFEHDREVTQDITSADTTALSKLTYAVHQHFFGKDMEALGDVLDTFGRELITAMQILFPEFATEMAYAEIAGDIIRFLGSENFKQLQRALDTDGSGPISGALDKLKEIFDPEQLWAWFLMGDAPPALVTLGTVATAIGRLRKVKPEGDEQTRSTTSKVLGRLFGVGAIVLHDVERVHEAVKFPVDQFALFVQGSPLLAAALRLAARELQGLQGQSLADMAEHVGSDLRGELRDMYVHFLEIIKGLSALELPNELIPMHNIVEMVVNMVIDFLPAKYSYPIRKSQEISAVQELFQWIYKKVADFLVDQGFDPNRLWRSLVADHLNPLLKDAGGAVASAAKGLLDAVPHIKELNAWAGVEEPTPTVQFVAEDAIDKTLTASPKAEGAGMQTATPRLPSGGGRALDAATLAKAQSGYGHDFRHVRLHQGGAVDRSLREAGALAATSGSHVYIDSAHRQQPDLLNHELAHVLQQAGPRPLGGRHTALPVHANAPGGGWRIDVGDESNADALAAQAREPADAPRPVRRSAAMAMQPKLDLQGVIGSFFKMIGDPAKLREGAEQLGNKAIDKDAMAEAAPQLRTDLFALFRAALVDRAAHKVVSFKPPFKRIDDLLVDYVLDNHESKLQDAMPHLLMGGLAQIQYGTKKAPKSFWIIHPEHLKVQLQQYFFGVTGVSVDIEFNTIDPAGPDGRKHKTVDPRNPFKTIRFVFLHLPAIGGGAKLWNEIMKNSFDMNAADADKNKLRVRRALSALDPGVGLYVESDQHKLKFSKKAMDAIKAQSLGGMSGKLDPNMIPKWADYVDPKGRTPQVSGKETGEIGLRLGFYRDKGQPGGQTGVDRESHHTVQYLLMEYFSNTLPNRPFPQPLSLYPSLVGKGNEVTTIAAEPKGTTGILIEAGSRRGPNMPTVLLAASTHRSGVHVTTSADEESGGSSQSASVHKWWTTNLKNYRSLVIDKANRPQLEKLASLVKAKKLSDSVQVKGMSVTPKDLAEAIHDATNRTYNDIRDDMNKKLRDRIDPHEGKYYTDAVAAATEPKIFSNGKAKPDYEWKSVKSRLMSDVERRQKDAFDNTFGFTTR